MAKLKVSEDIVPISDFKAQASEWLRRIAISGHPLITTQNGKPAGVLLSPSAFDDLAERQEFLAAVQEGMADERAGRSYGTEEVFDAIHKRISGIDAD